MTVEPQQAEAGRSQLSGRLWAHEPDPDVLALGGVRVFSLRSLETDDEAIIFVPPKP
jgi:hypothetical protein